MTSLKLFGLKRNQRYIVDLNGPFYVEFLVRYENHEVHIDIPYFKDRDDTVPAGTFSWNPPKPYKIFACWRTIRILSQILQLKEADIAAAYTAANGFVQGPGSEEAQKIVAGIGTGVYVEILSAIPPTEVVDRLINLADHKKPIDLEEIALEVSCRIISWRADFTRIGAVRHRITGERKHAQDRLLRRYRRPLRRYARSQGEPMDSKLIEFVCFGIIEATEKGIGITKKGVNPIYGRAAVFGIAAVRGKIEYYHWIRSRDPARKHIPLMDVEASVPRTINEVALGLAQSFRISIFHRRPIMTRSEFVNILTRLWKDWDTLPSIPANIP